ncbi:WxL domain-containing protein [Lactiplantibacillus pentosus]|uniref:Cell surface protein n=1 Tax=Lactiplantibacillus pentosus TaxID=1589 RepID=A0ABX5CXF7_LACPE|nr:WxL domain-containing protein [Lactiplantibacillus pentosus]PRO93804.1 cell surface protein [Lactiplantibacillus pentosus]
MKKYIGTLVAGMTLMAGLPLVGQAADKTTEAQVKLEQDENNKDITLDEAPALDIGTVTIDNTTQTKTADTVTGSVKVTNPGNTDGWSVQVAGSKFLNGSQELRGAALTFKNASVTADDEANASKNPTAPDVTVNESNQMILGAVANEGIGKFTSAYAKTDVSLLVPAGNSAGAYTSTLTWTLGNAPS